MRLPHSRAAAPLRPPLAVLGAGRTVLLDRPRGRPLAVVGARTPFGSPMVLGVVRRHRGWLGVTSPALANGRLGWVADERVRLFSVGYEIRVRISRREAVVLRGHRALFRFTVAVGRAATPTPLGRFAVTDKLRIRGTASYGCCALPISGRQPNLPQGWGGGDRLAIHGTSDPASIGGAVSMGCLRASDQALRRLLVTVPLGTPVIVSG